MAATDLKALLKRVMELVMPNLRAYYRMPVKARVEATYASDGRYWADVQPLRNDESVDESSPVIPHVEIPIEWGGPMRGVVCPPLVGTHVVISFFDGDPDYPWISHIRWHGHGAPACEVGAFIIQREDGTYIKIDVDNNIIHVTPANRISEIGTDKTEDIGGDKTLTVGGKETREITGDKEETVYGNWTVVVDGAATLQAPTINLVGNISSMGTGGGVGTVTESSNRSHDGSYELTGPMVVTGNVQFTGPLIVSGNVTAADFITA